MIHRLCTMLAGRVCLALLGLFVALGQAVAQPSVTAPQAPAHEWWREAIGGYEIGGDAMMYGDMIAPASGVAATDPYAEDLNFLGGARAVVAKPLLTRFMGVSPWPYNHTSPRAVAVLIDGTASLGVGGGPGGNQALFVSAGPRLGSNMYWRRLAYEVRMGPELLMQTGDEATVAAVAFSFSMALAFPGREGWRRQHKFVISESIAPTTAAGGGSNAVTIWIGLGYRLVLN